jgi:hypothetical protein
MPETWHRRRIAVLSRSYPSLTVRHAGTSPTRTRRNFYNQRCRHAILTRGNPRDPTGLEQLIAMIVLDHHEEAGKVWVSVEPRLHPLTKG